MYFSFNPEHYTSEHIRYSRLETIYLVLEARSLSLLARKNMEQRIFEKNVGQGKKNHLFLKQLHDVVLLALVPYFHDSCSRSAH